MARAIVPDWLARMLEDMDEKMLLRGLSRGTRKLYVAHVRRFYPGGGYRGPAVGNAEVRQWLVHLLSSGRSHS